MQMRNFRRGRVGLVGRDQEKLQENAKRGRRTHWPACEVRDDGLRGRSLLTGQGGGGWPGPGWGVGTVVGLQSGRTAEEKGPLRAVGQGAGPCSFS